MDRIIAHVPPLRRFARALTGSQRSGDAYVGATLETIAEDTSMIDGEGTAVALFRVFCHVWRTVDLNTSSADTLPVDASEANASSRLASLVPQERLVFLLRHLEGFSPSQTAEILGRPLDEIETLTEAAAADIAAQLSSRILVIEDEPVIALDLESLVSRLGHEVTSVARTHSDAVAAARSDKPDLILADVKLADGSSGIEAANEIMSTMDVPVVFITAYPDRLLTGERPEPTFLISKPYDPEVVKAMISQVLFFGTGEKSTA